MAETRMIPGVGLVRKNDDGSFEVIAPSGASPATDVSRIVAPNPVRAAKEAQDQARRDAADARANAASERAADAASRDASNDGMANQIKALEIKLKERELAGEDPKAAKEERTRLTTLRSLANQINRVQSLYEKGPGATKGLSALQDYLPSDANAAFDTAGASLSAQGLAAFRVPGTGTVSDRDAMMFDRANLPEASNRDAATEEQLRGIKARVEEEFKALGMAVPKWDPAVEDVFAAKPMQKADNEVPDPTTGANLKPPAPGIMDPGSDPGDGVRQSVASGPTRSIFDPRVSAQVDALMNSGASKAVIDAVLTRQGLRGIDAPSFNAAKAWMKQNPGKKYFGANVSREEDMSLLQRAAGSDTGAFLAQMGNAATAGIPAALAGPSGQGALDAMAANSPNASIVGGTIGSMTGALGGEAAIAARAPAALAKYAPRIADTLFGGLSGFNQSREGEGGAGAATGAAAGLIGGMVGERAMRGAGAVARGVRDPAIQALRGLNIPLTTGQALGSSGMVGRGIKKMEDAATSIPFVGNMIEARRREGFEGLNRAAFDIGSQTTGGQVQDYGAAGIQQLEALKSQAYRDALDPVTLDLAGDQQFPVDLINTQISARSIPQVGDDAVEALDYRIGGGTDNAGMMGGRDFQEAYRGLARDGRAAANGPYANEFSGAMRAGQNSLSDALERQNPGAFQGFTDANTANRRLMVLADAVDSAKNTEGQLFSPAQLNMADARSANRLTGKLASASGDRPFHDLATAAQQVLPSKLSDSGTSTRMLTGLALGGGAGAGAGYTMGDTGTGTATGLGLSLLLAAGGSRPAQRAMTTALLDRPDAAVRLGDILQEYARLGGAAGAGGATNMIAGY